MIATLKVGQKQAVLTCFCPRHMGAHGPFIYPGYAGAMEVGVHVYVYEGVSKERLCNNTTCGCDN